MKTLIITIMTMFLATANADAQIWKKAENDVVHCSEKVDTQIDNIIETQLLMQNLPGIAVAVFKNDQVIHLKTYGYTNVIDKEEINLNTVLRWASVSKSVTGTAALQLMQDPDIRFDVQDTVRKHVSYWPASINICENYDNVCGNVGGSDNRYGSITIEQLLFHRSGIQHYGRGTNGSKTPITFISGIDSLEFIRKRHSDYTPDPINHFNAESSVDIFKHSVLDFEPGSAKLYSSYGYNLLGAAIDASAPDGYVNWVMKHIARPANMRSFRVAKLNNNDRLISRYNNPAAGQNIQNGGIVTIEEASDKEFTLPAGGWESNICDFARYALSQALVRFTNKNRDKIWTNTQGGEGYGVDVNGTMVSHGGKHNNSRTYMEFIPDTTGQSKGFVLMCPAEYAKLKQVATYLREYLNNGSVTRKHTPKDACRVDMDEENEKADDRFNAVWRKTNKADEDIIVRTGYKQGAFQEEYKKLRKHGYYCKDIEPFIYGGKLYWDAVFMKGSGSFVFRSERTRRQFREFTRQKADEGYKLYDVEIYMSEDGSRRWTGLYRKTNESYAFVTNRSHANFRDEREEQQSKGRKLIDIEVFIENGNKYWSGVWAEGEPNKMNRNLTKNEFDELWRSRRNEDYNLIDFERYQDNGVWRYAGIWEPSNISETYQTDDDFCRIMNFHEDNSANGYELIDFERNVN